MKNFLQNNGTDSKFKHFQQLVLEHLSTLEDKEDKDREELKKSLISAERMQKSGYPVGTIREWKGKKFIKIAPGKWKPKYDSQTRGAKMSIAAIRRKAESCKDSKELMQLVLDNRDRFSDENGRPLPFVKELSDYISGLNDKVGITKKLREQLIQTLEPYFGKVIENLSTGIKSRISKKTADKMGSEKAIEKSKKNGFTVQQHFEVANNIVELYEKAELKKTRPDRNNNPNIKSIKRFVSPTKLKDGQDVNAYITVKESTMQGHKLYSVELTEINKASVKTDALGDAAVKDSETATPERAHVSDTNISQSDKKSSNDSEETEQEKHDNRSKEKNRTNSIETIRDNYQKGNSVDGDEDSITMPDGTELEGKWKLVEAGAPSASHDETTFSKTEGFPTNEDGSTINDRDYEHDNAAKEAVLDIASDFDARALSLDSPVVVSEDGVVISGNNRTMSSKLAARKGTDKKYIEALNKKAKKFGFSVADVSKFKNPRVVFETKVNGEYSTKQFAAFNQSGKKAQSPVEQAVKVAKTVTANTVENIAEKINEYDTLGELYADNKAMQDVFSTLITNGVIQKTDLPAYYTQESGVSNNGKEFLETVLIGSVINENNIRSLSSAGGKSIRQKLVRAIVPLVENKGLKGYSITKELNEAVRIAVEVAKNHDKFPSVEEFSKQNDMFRDLDSVSVELAKKLEGTQKEFAEFMREINGGLKPAANGEADIFLGGVESKDEILNRYLSIKKAVAEVLRSLIA